MDEPPLVLPHFDFHKKFLRTLIPLGDIVVRQPINATIFVVNGSAWINKRGVINPRPPPQIISAKLIFVECSQRYCRCNCSHFQR